jgi:broad specificity phosphatase PhoE
MNIEQAQKYLISLGINVCKSVTKPTKPGKQPRPVWEIKGTLASYEQLLYDLGAKKWQGTFCCWEDPTVELALAISEQGKSSFAEQQERLLERAQIRAERLEARSQKHSSVAQQAFETADAIAQNIPLGQPILLGHHSEKRHRRDLAKIDRNMRTCIDESNYAKRLGDRARTNWDKSEGKHITIEYVGNRIQEATAEIAKIERILSGDGNSEQYSAFLKASLEQSKEALDYWKQKYIEIGGDKYSPNTIAVGDKILYIGRWAKVLKVNAKTVKITNEFWQCEAGTNIPYHKIKGHRKLNFD